MASKGSKISAAVGVLCVSLCLFATPAFSFAGFMAPFVALPLALYLRGSGLLRSAFLTGFIGVAAAALVLLQDRVDSEAFLYVWGAVLTVALLVLASYFIARQRVV